MGRSGFGRSAGRSRLSETEGLSRSQVHQYQEPLVSNEESTDDLESGAHRNLAVAPVPSYSAVDNASEHTNANDQSSLSEYTVNTSHTTANTNAVAVNTLLQDVAFSQEQMESALTTGTESLHE